MPVGSVATSAFGTNGMAWQALKPLEPDAILGLMAAFQADPDPNKVDLSVGVYRDAAGQTPILGAVAEAEAALVREQDSKSYLPPLGVPGFRSRMLALVLGPLANSLGARTAVIQTPGGCGALRLAAELFGRARPEAPVCLSDPTWANHRALMAGAGLRIRRYPYYDPATHALRLGPMLEALRETSRQSLVLLQASCHNPTGADPDKAAWSAVLDMLAQRELLPLFDLAYQGLGDGLDEDAAAVRMAAEQLPELLVAVSASKNFGLYRERTGALLALGASPTVRATLESQLAHIARGAYAMPPAQGALIVERILAAPELSRAWRGELEAMRRRLNGLRRALADALADLRPDLDLSWLAERRGLFSLLGIDAKALDRLREDRHIYIVRDGRINIAGLRNANLAPVAEALAPLLGQRSA